MTERASRASAIEVRDLMLRREGFSLGPISFSMAAGRGLGVRGPNGCGKSSLLLALAGLLELTGGEIRQSDQLLSDPVHRVEPRHRGIGLLLQDLGLFPHLTIAKQCQLVAGSSADRISRVAQALEVTGLLDRKPVGLSGGEAQRCALVRTLASRSPIVLLDEPLAAQHADGRALVERVIESERSDGVTVIVASHIDTPCDEYLDLE